MAETLRLLAQPIEKGNEMIRLYCHPTPDPAKVVLLLEEAGLPYEVAPIDTLKRDQHAVAFRAVNPNGKAPAIVDTEGPGGREARVFDSASPPLPLQLSGGGGSSRLMEF